MLSAFVGFCCQFVAFSGGVLGLVGRWRGVVDMGMKPIHIYVAFVSAAAVLAIVSQDWPQFLSLPPASFSWSRIPNSSWLGLGGNGATLNS